MASASDRGGTNRGLSDAYGSEAGWTTRPLMQEEGTGGEVSLAHTHVYKMLALRLAGCLAVLSGNEK